MDGGGQLLSPALRYHGGKFRLAPWIIEHMPPHACYVESFGGAAGVLLRKGRAYAEVYNDLDGDVVNFFICLRDPALRARLVEACEFTPYARHEFENAWLETDDVVERARRTAIRAMMGFGSAGATKGSTGFRSDTRRKYGTAMHCWDRYPAAIAAAGVRFEGVLIERRPALDVMRAYDARDTLHFVDPPYLHGTRQMRAQGGYRHELSDGDHWELLQVLRQLEGMVVLCGYASDLYRDSLQGWTLRERQVQISGGRGSSVRTECLWLNPSCAEALDLNIGSMFSEPPTNLKAAEH